MRKVIKCEKKNTHIYPLRDKVICGCCNHTMSRKSMKSPVFICRHSLVDENAPCHKLEIKEKETTLLNIANVISNEDTLNKTLRDLLINKVFVYPDNIVEIVWKVQKFN